MVVVDVDVVDVVLVVDVVEVVVVGGTVVVVVVDVVVVGSGAIPTTMITSAPRSTSVPGSNTLLCDPSVVGSSDFKIDVFDDVREFMFFAREKGVASSSSKPTGTERLSCRAARHKQGDL